VIERVSKDISSLFLVSSSPVGLILDESGHRKSGKKSVGVARQYLGSIGKTDNGQVGVFCALSQQDRVALIGARLYLPKCWTDDKKRCKKAGIPLDQQAYKTKPELALEMIKGLAQGVAYDWIGGDSLYGSSTPLRKELQRLDKLFVMDVGENLHVYLEDPKPYIPASKSGRGRKKSSYISDGKSLKAKELLTQLDAADWKQYTFRTGTKEPMQRKVVVFDVYVWSAKRVTEQYPEKLRLIISTNPDGTEVKYSLTNEGQVTQKNRLSDCDILYRQMQRYWIERSFQDCKDVLGMTDYQVRKWMAWHHHITLTIMALHIMLLQKIKHQETVPLLSCPDIKFFLAMNLPQKAEGPEQVWSLIQKRHQQRQADLDRYKSKI
jgi:SRSO17 transposase